MPVWGRTCRWCCEPSWWRSATAGVRHRNCRQRGRRLLAAATRLPLAEGFCAAVGAGPEWNQAADLVHPIGADGSDQSDVPWQPPRALPTHPAEPRAHRRSLLLRSSGAGHGGGGLEGRVLHSGNLASALPLAWDTEMLRKQFPKRCNGDVGSL